ncbi:polyadenylate binding domain-containing protein [Candidatus Venteria ishoeyi]|uniref:Uncharacterized protein n=1 Tax=Candidatus Venteria ishoeyi TaxID=1899563 RepID=A0A1H6FGT5_9GAMM|nr:hypothetical protein [Candidatus Venteria ishoeyi]SEH08873.1 Uncharacterised protein [Candidatus Venteria ishoeyi]
MKHQIICLSSLSALMATAFPTISMADNNFMRPPPPPPAEVFETAQPQPSPINNPWRNQQTTPASANQHYWQPDASPGYYPNQGHSQSSAQRPLHHYPTQQQGAFPQPMGQVGQQMPSYRGQAYPQPLTPGYSQASGRTYAYPQPSVAPQQGYNAGNNSQPYYGNQQIPARQPQQQPQQQPRYNGQYPQNPQPAYYPSAPTPGNKAPDYYMQPDMSRQNAPRPASMYQTPPASTANSYYTQQPAAIQQYQAPTNPLQMMGDSMKSVTPNMMQQMPNPAYNPMPITMMPNMGAGQQPDMGANRPQLYPQTTRQNMPQQIPQAPAHQQPYQVREILGPAPGDPVMYQQRTGEPPGKQKQLLGPAPGDPRAYQERTLAPLPTTAQVPHTQAEKPVSMPNSGSHELENVVPGMVLEPPVTQPVIVETTKQPAPPASVAPAAPAQEAVVKQPVAKPPVVITAPAAEAAAKPELETPKLPAAGTKTPLPVTQPIVKQVAAPVTPNNEAVVKQLADTQVPTTTAAQKSGQETVPENPKTAVTPKQ